MCTRFGCLPQAGGLLEQDAQFLRLVAVYDLAHGGPQHRGPAAIPLERSPEPFEWPDDVSEVWGQ